MQKKNNIKCHKIHIQWIVYSIVAFIEFLLFSEKAIFRNSVFQIFVSSISFVKFPTNYPCSRITEFNYSSLFDRIPQRSRVFQNNKYSYSIISNYFWQSTKYVISEIDIFRAITVWERLIIVHKRHSGQRFRR